MLQISIDTAGIAAELDRSLEEVTAQVMRSIAEDVPEEMRDLMSVSGGRSKPGEPPHRQTGSGVRSLTGRVISPTEAEISMNWYLEYLDSEKERTFIEPAVTRTLQKNI